MPETITGIEQYELQSVSLASADQATLKLWESFCGRHLSTSHHQDPAWLSGFFARELSNVTAYFLRHSGELQGVAPFLLKDWPLNWYLGEMALARPPLRRLRFLGDTLNLPEEEAVYDILFAELAKSRRSFDAVHFEAIPLDSFLWKYLQSSPLIRRSFRMYVPEPPASHVELRFGASFDQYMKKFSAKSRSTLRRKIKRIRDGVIGPMRLVRYTDPRDVPAFLESAVAVSKKTYQWNLLQKGMSDTDLVAQRLAFAAEHGWLRCYMLFCNDVPCAFLSGFQNGGVYSLLDTGFDPDLSKYSVGMVLQLLAIEDLFAENTPRVYDFGTWGGWKQELSTDSYPEVKVLLFQPGAYTRMIQTGHRGTQIFTKAVGSLLERMNLKVRLKKLIRGMSEKNAPAQATEESEAE